MYSKYITDEVHYMVEEYLNNPKIKLKKQDGSMRNGNHIGSFKKHFIPCKKVAHDLDG